MRIRLLDPGDWLGMKPKIDPAAERLELHFQPPRDEVKARIWLGGVLVAAGAAAVGIWGMESEAPFFAAVLGLLGLSQVGYGLIQRGYRLDLEISDFEVHKKTRSIFGDEEWRERLSAFDGVMLREEEFREERKGKVERVTRYQVIELRHADERKTVPLYVVQGMVAPMEAHQAFGRRLNLPLLGMGMEGAVRVEREGRGTDPGPAPAGIDVTEVEGVVCLSLTAAGWFRVISWVAWVALPVGIGAVLWQFDPEFGKLAGIGTAGLFLLLFLMDWAGRRKQRVRGLCVSREGVWIGEAGGAPRMVLRYGEVRQVRADRVRGGRYRVVVDGGNLRVEFGGDLWSRKRVEWVRDYVRWRMGEALRRQSCGGSQR